MLLKIYLGISKIFHYIKIENPEKIKGNKTDKFGLLLFYIRLIIACFIPVLNIGLLLWAGYLFVLCDDEECLNKLKSYKS